jgi:hypothetical protein
MVWFYGLYGNGLKPWKNHGEMVLAMCLPIKLLPKHVSHRKSLAFRIRVSVQTI